MNAKKTQVIFALALLLGMVISLGSCASQNGEFNIETGRIGVLTGSTGEAYAAQNYTEADIRSYSNVMDAVVALGAGKLDAVLTSDVVAMLIALEDRSLIIEGDKLTNESVSVVLRKDETELLSTVNGYIGQMLTDGTLPDLITRWTENLPPIQTSLPMVDTDKTFKVGVTANRAPFSYIEGGEIIGLAPEVAYRLGEKLGVKIEFVVMEFSSLIPALQSGKIDAVIDLLVYTDERAKSVNFSTVYYDSGQVILRQNPDYIEEKSFFARIKNSFISNLITDNRWKMLADGLVVTLEISVFSFILATLLGFIVCFLNMSGMKILNFAGKLYLLLMRGVPMVVLLMVTYFVFFAKVSIDPILVAIIAFGINSGASIGELLRSSIETVDKGQQEAARSMGFGRLQTFLTVTFPQAARIASSTYKSEFVALFKGTAIVGYISIIDLTKAGDMIRAATFDAFFPLIIVALVYLVAVSLIIKLFDIVINATDKRRKRA